MHLFWPDAANYATVTLEEITLVLREFTNVYLN